MSWKSSAEYWRQVPLRSTLIFCSAVFSLFASFPFISGASSNPIQNLGFGFLNGVAAAFYAIAGTRKLFKLMAVLLVAQIAGNTGLGFLFSKLAPRLNSLWPAHRADINSTIAIVLIIAGYSLFLGFMGVEAQRYYATLTEMRLAGEIHRSLVPEIHLVEHSFEFYGHSWPSGEVGGDLVDVIRGGWGWLAYVADVSGHGVPAGVLMTMMKSAARTRLAAVGPDRFLPAMNEILMPLSSPNMYVTLAFLGYSDGTLQFATAGHPPILHYRHASGQVEEHANENFPVALLGNADFKLSQIPVQPGDVLVILTDGLTEVADSSDRELGLTPLKTMLEKNATAPLPDIAGRLRASALAHGKQTDDQTLLLVRITPAPATAPLPAQ